MQKLLLVTEHAKIAQQITDTNSIASCFATVSRTNTLFGGSKWLSTHRLFSLLQSIDLLMKIENQMCTIRDN